MRKETFLASAWSDTVFTNNRSRDNQYSDRDSNQLPPQPISFVSIILTHYQ